MFYKAMAAGILTPLATTGVRKCTSIYADDVITFIKPDVQSLRACAALLYDFGVASGLSTNLTKCSAHPIRCSDEQKQLIAAEIECQVLGWPCKYLGLPLGLRKITAAQLQYMVDKMADKLPAWQARLLYRDGRLELLRSTSMSMPIHAMMALDLPIKTITAANKICRGFLWKGRREVNGGHCIIAWNQVCSPKEHGGLGVPNLRYLNSALRARWPWLQRTDSTRPWSEFNIQVSDESMGIYKAATRCTLGDGEMARFWTDWWLSDGRIEDTMPHLYAMVKKRGRQITVKQALTAGWWQDMSPDMGTQALFEFMALVDLTQHVELRPGIEDAIAWTWESSGTFSARSAYRAHFAGRIESAGAVQVWRCRAPPACKFFTWLATRNRCWTANRLQRRQLPHPSACPFCDQLPETLDHLLLGCVLARQVWSKVMNTWSRPDWTPSADSKLVEWWTTLNPQNQFQKEAWTVITLVLWMLWKHRNDIVFNGASPSVDDLLVKIELEAQEWRAAGLLRERGSVICMVDRRDESE